MPKHFDSLLGSVLKTKASTVHKIERANLLFLDELRTPDDTPLGSFYFRSRRQGKASARPRSISESRRTALTTQGLLKGSHPSYRSGQTAPQSEPSTAPPATDVLFSMVRLLRAMTQRSVAHIAPTSFRCAPTLKALNSAPDPSNKITVGSCFFSFTPMHIQIAHAVILSTYHTPTTSNRTRTHASVPCKSELRGVHSELEEGVAQRAIGQVELLPEAQHLDGPGHHLVTVDIDVHSGFRDKGSAGPGDNGAEEEGEHGLEYRAVHCAVLRSNLDVEKIKLWCLASAESTVIMEEIRADSASTISFLLLPDITGLCGRLSYAREDLDSYFVEERCARYPASHDKYGVHPQKKLHNCAEAAGALVCNHVECGMDGCDCDVKLALHIGFLDHTLHRIGSQTVQVSRHIRCKTPKGGPHGNTNLYKEQNRKEDQINHAALYVRCQNGNGNGSKSAGGGLTLSSWYEHARR
ncbi:hypothetical protein FOMPIDRAFT_1015754 [Fomitopsis schrenkii]|uniref:Uncharacterized protein n=1 Tax=Fomitopsis schrenkii TaxID=2126942 RepID=S8EEW3_FOMSC|nr:hypothetical protein FOMPIDRAFT_1015754 [Fomitopsis schrenkii]